MTVFRLGRDALARLSSEFFAVPRELAGVSVHALETTLARFGDDHPALHVEAWYRGAEPASYDSVAAAAAYLGAYGPRSYLKYQEAVLGLFALSGGVPETWQS
jgi:lipopolysaccharide export LptBFGC system permease protein LptF